MHGKWIPSVICVCVLLSACGSNDSGKTMIGVAETAKEYETISYEKFKRSFIMQPCLVGRFRILHCV